MAFLPIFAYSQSSGLDIPVINPTIVIMNTSIGDSAITDKSYSGNAPLEVKFIPDVVGDVGWDTYYEWRFYEGVEDGQNITYDTVPYLQRYEEETEYTFREKKPTKIELYAIFTHEGDTVLYTEEYWSGEEADSKALYIDVYESILNFPNAFSPNGDHVNDIFKAKSGYRSIVEFHATIFNRWGQKIYEWFDPAGGWDGTQNGRPVKEGVYFLYCRAKGADGHKFVFKKDVNLLRTFREDQNATTE